jgi:hypothetical protein
MNSARGEGVGSNSRAVMPEFHREGDAASTLLLSEISVMTPIDLGNAFFREHAVGEEHPLGANVADRFAGEVIV